MARPWLRRVVLTVAYLLLAVGVLGVIGVIGLSRFALPLVLHHIAQTTGYQVLARSMDFNFSRGIVLEDVRVISPEHQTIFTTSRFYVRPRWGELIRHRELVIDEVEMDTAGGQFLGRGQISKDLDADVQVDYVAKTTRKKATSSGVLRAKLIQGRGPIVIHLAQGPLQISATAQVNIPAKTFEAVIHTGAYAWNATQPHPWDIKNTTIKMRGDFSHWNVQVLVHLRKQATLRYRGTIEKVEQIWRIGWDNIVLHLPSGPEGKPQETDWRTARAGNASLGETGEIRIPDLQLTDGHGYLKGAFVVAGPGSQDMSLRASRVSLQPLITWAYPEKQVEGIVDGTLHLQGTLKEPSGKFEIAFSSGRIQGTAMEDVRAAVRLEPPWIILDRLSLKLPQTDRDLTGRGRVPWHLVQPSSPNLPMDLRFETADVDPQFLGSFMPGIEIGEGGHLNFSVVVRGEMPKVTVEGQAAVKVPLIRYAAAGVELKDLDLAVKSQGRRAEIQQGQASMGKGRMRLSGEIVWPRLNIALTADNATLSIPKQFELKTDAYIKVGGELSAMELTGEIRPKEATYTVAKKKKKKKTEKSEDPTPPPQPSVFWRALRMDIRTVWDHRVWYRDGLTKIETAADLHARKERGATEITLAGPLSLVRGSYDAYGRDFVIQSGDLNFTGPPANPILSIQAEYRARDYIVNLSVSGTAQKPQFKFTSSPPLSEQEILSLLVTGRASNQISSSEEDGSDDQAKEMAADVASTYLTKSLRESGLNLGLDVVRVTPSASGTVWTVGRYLGPDLFVSYGQSPKDSASSIVTADYSLTRRWTISTQASSTSDTFLDFLFRYPLGHRPSKK